MRYFSMAALVVALATLVGCTKEEINNGLTFTTTVEMPANVTKALDGNGVKTFAVGECIKVTCGGVTCTSEPLTTSDISFHGKAAKFTFNFESAPTLTEDTPVTYEYPSTYSGLDGQNGTIEYIAEHCDYATWTGTVTVEGKLPSNIQLENQYAILKLKINYNDNDITSSITGLTVTNGINTVSVSPSSLSEIYVALPETSGDIVFTATDGSNSYTKTVTGQTLAQGSLYPVNLTVQLPECSYTAPTLRTGLTFNGNRNNVAGSAQNLVNAGTVENGTMYYSKDGSNWSTDVPTQTNAGSYTVYYKVVPDDGYSGGVESTSLGTANMAKASGWCSLSPNSSDGWKTSWSEKSATSSISHHGGQLSWSKSGDYAYNLSVSISGNTLYLTRKAQSPGSGTIVTVTSAATQNYNAASATYTCNY